MRIQVTVPKGLGSFQVIKSDNHPFTRLFEAYIASLNDLAKTGLDIFGIVGYVSSQLCVGQPYFSYEPMSENARVLIAVEDDLVIPLVESSLLTRSEVLMQAIRLLHDLSLYHGTNLVKLIYLLRQLDRYKTKRQVPHKDVYSDKHVDKHVDVDNHVEEVVAKPKRRTVKVEPVVDTQPSTQMSDDPVARAKALIQRIDSGSREDVVETNPLLADFI